MNAITLNAINFEITAVTYINMPKVFIIARLSTNGGGGYFNIHHEREMHKSLTTGVQSNVGLVLDMKRDAKGKKKRKA